MQPSVWLWPLGFNLLFCCVCICQAVGALFVGMLSELVYTSILGLLGGLAYGEC